MKRNNYFRRIACLFLILSASFYLHAQVTIGNSEKPATGAILQLKNMEDANGINSTKGLMLPRVHLTAMNDIANGDISGVTTENKDLHVGLMVYNTNRCANNRTDARGVYIWSGTTWESVMDSPIYTDNYSIDYNTGIMTDFEGNKYQTRVYGKTRWMIQNLRSLRAADGSYINCEEGVKLNHPLGVWNTPNDYTIVARDEIPKGDPITYMTKDVNGLNQQSVTLGREEFANKFGLSYTSPMARVACPKG